MKALAMQMTRRTLLLSAGIVSATAVAQEASPLRIVFSFAPGGAADAIARLLAEDLRARLGRPVIVENRTGGGGRIGAQAVKAAPPDGSTLLLAATTQMVLQPHTDPAIGYDPVADFRPVVQVMRFGQVIAVGPDNPARSPAELIAWFRADPARRSFGSPGIGTGAHFAGLEFGRLGGVVLEHVAYRGTPAALPDLQTGRLGMFVASFGEFREHHRAGRVRILASTEAERSPAAPGIPTLRESGFDIVAPGWFALYAPAGTPDTPVARLSDRIPIGWVARRRRQAAYNGGCCRRPTPPWAQPSPCWQLPHLPYPCRRPPVRVPSGRLGLLSRDRTRRPGRDLRRGNRGQ